jgi:peptidoglycan/LPS O-acetylase OafA/YrhL
MLFYLNINDLIIGFNIADLLVSAMMPARPLTLPLARETSLYIDVVRVLAALVVFCDHFARPAISGGLFWQVAPFGGDAVIVFFVISGFVIAHATVAKERNAADYFTSRAARIYSVAVPAIVLTLVCDFAGRWIDPQYTSWSYSTGALWQQVLTTLTFTNAFWGLNLFPGSDGAYWSLGYEVPYYMIFGAALFARGSWRVVLPVLFVLMAGPSIAALFPIWLLGVGAYRLGRVWKAREALGWTLFFGSIAAWGAGQFGLHAAGYPIEHVGDSAIVPDYVTGICFAINLLGFEAIAPRYAALLRPCARAIRWTAGRSFTIYLVHIPVLKLCAVMPFWNVNAWSTRAAMIAITALVVVVIGACFEQRREPWRRFFASLFGRAQTAPAALRAAR